MLSRTKIGLSLSPLACPTSGLTLATCLRLQRVAIGAAIMKPDERPGCVASRAGFSDTEANSIQDPVVWSPRRQLRRAANSFLRTALLGTRLLVTSGCRVIAVAGIWITSVGRVAQTGLEWAIIQFRDLDRRENRYLRLDYNEPLRQSANIESPLGAPHGIVTLKILTRTVPVYVEWT